ncbi:tetratricopeptide repeat protein [Galbibacter sp. EGI 63066]|uniref:tetratricopeptide repeat protein n=1 Tax=Galbibacter sp. EGI 63066 TaxID=2993559 RepID=UPI002248FDCE|nr:tetratricopeptide repeat protein [Galbibacter sp. EGI 63066]MCX2679946.1 tetratricopeptide repeat protein [Galbibacter sp. EGI 63066]
MKKRILILVGVLGVVFYSYGQAQNPECPQNLSIFAEHAKVKNYDSAYEPWKMVYDNCPTLHYAIYHYGEKILKDKIEKDPANKEKYIKTLTELYKSAPQNFPKRYTVVGSLIDAALLKYNYKLGTNEEIYGLLDKAYKTNRDDFKNPKALYLYFSTLVDMNAAGKKDLQEVFDTYDDVTGKIEEENQELAETIVKYLPKEEKGTITSKEKKILAAARQNGANYEKISGSIDGKLGKLADCDNLIPLYNKNFDAHQNDANWLKSAAGRMDSKGCTGDPLFVKLVEALDKIEPSANSKYYLGSLYEEQGNSTKALEFYKQSIDLESDNVKKAKKLINIASKASRRGQKSTARKYAQQALDVNPANGTPYLILANLYANSANDCGSTTFEKRAMYWKAEQTARRAGQVDPSLKSKAAQSAASYKAKAPSKQDIFSSGMAGKTIKFNCWVGGSVKVPNL